MGKDRIVQQFDEAYTEAYYAWNDYYPKAERDLRYYLGDQWDDKEKRKLFEEGRSAFVFNRIKRVIDSLVGYQIKNRLSSVVIPQENGDQKTADQMSQLLLYVLSHGNAYELISNAFAGALKTGWNLLEVYMDYSSDPLDGDICFVRTPFSGFICDPYFSSLEWRDCNYLMKRKYLSAAQTASMLPEHKKLIYDLQKYGWERDDKFTWLPYQRQPNGEDLLAYNEYFEQKWKNVPYLIDTETAEYMEFNVPKERQQMLLSMYDNLKIIERPKRYIEKHIIVNDEHIKSEINPYGLDEYPCAPCVAVWEPESDEWGLKLQSAIRVMIDPQKESNRRRSQMIDIIDSQINSGWIAEDGSIVNPRSLFQSSQGKVIWKKPGSQPGSIEKILPAQVPPSMFQMQELFDRDVNESIGINDASFGMPESGNESGIMMMLRQSSALTGQQILFDNLRACQKAISRKVLKLIQNWSPKKIERILNEPPSEQFYNVDLTKYDISIQEGLLTDSQKQMSFRQMVDLYQITGGPNGSPITPQMLYEASVLQGKSKVNEQIIQNQQAQQQQAQEQAQIQQQLLDSQSKMAQAKAISDVALAKERFTRSVANLGLEDERASKAIQDRADSALSRVKAIKELQQMDDEKLLRYLSIVRMMEESNAIKETQIKADDVMITKQSSIPSQQSVAALQQSAAPSQIPQQMGV